MKGPFSSRQPGVDRYLIERNRCATKSTIAFIAREGGQRVLRLGPYLAPATPEIRHRPIAAKRPSVGPEQLQRAVDIRRDVDRRPLVGAPRVETRELGKDVGHPRG